MAQVISILLNGISWQMFVSCYIIGLAGFILSLAQNVKKGIANQSNDTPPHLSWSVLFNQNWLRIIQNIIGIAVGIILARTLLGETITLPLSLAIGAGVDRLIIMKLQGTQTPSEGTPK